MQPEVNPKNLGVKMLRRDFGKVALGAIASSALLRSAKGANVTPAAEFPKTPGLTDYVGRFVVNTTYEDIPADVIELGKKSILDGLGLALAGSRAQTGTICRQYLEDLSICGGKAIVIGSALKTSPRFAAFVNGVSIHADDFDDTQLSAAKDRVYGLLVHPTVPVLPAVLALSERRKISGKELMLSYHVGVEVECKIAEAISPRHYQDGFHSTGTCGALGSAAACAKLLRFDQSTLLHHQPKTGLEAKFSMEFCLAILLLERKAGLGEFSDKVVQRADVQEMIRRINFYVDPQAESAGFDKMTSILKIHLRDGRAITGRADFAKGSPANPMSFDDAASKFRGCAEYANWPKLKTEKIIAFVRTLDSAPDVSALTPLLSAEKG